MSYRSPILCVLCIISSQGLMLGLGSASWTCASSSFEFSFEVFLLIWLCVGYWCESFSNSKWALFKTRTSSKCRFLCCSSSCWSSDSSWRNSIVSCEFCTQFQMWVRLNLSTMIVLSTKESNKVLSNSKKSLIWAMEIMTNV